MRGPLHQSPAAIGPPPHEAKLRREDRSFADCTAKLAGLAGALLGWRPDEFWAATPAELGAVFGALNPREEAPADGALLAELKERFPDG